MHANHFEWYLAHSKCSIDIVIIIEVMEVNEVHSLIIHSTHLFNSLRQRTSQTRTLLPWGLHFRRRDS